MREYSGGITWTAYLKVIFPLANILYEMREDERRQLLGGNGNSTAVLLFKKTIY